MQRRKKQYRFWWYEGASAYYAVDNETGEEAVMGDGVDMFVVDKPDGSQRTLSPGTAAFNRAMDDMFRTSQGEIGEAYFNVYDD